MLSTAAHIKPGDRVAVILPTIPEYWLLQAACLRTGIAFHARLQQNTQGVRKQYTETNL